MPRLRPVVAFTNSVEMSVYLKPVDQQAYGSRSGRRSRRNVPRDTYELDDFPFWTMVIQRFKPTPWERLVLQSLAAKGEIKLYAREADLEPRLRSAINEAGRLNPIVPN